MKLSLQLSESPFVLEAKNEDGIITYLDAAPNIGGKGKGMRPMEFLASSLAGCMAIDILIILRKQRLDVTVFKIDIEADRREQIPSRFETIHLIFTVNKEVPLEKLEHAIHLSHEKYCSVSASLSSEIEIKTSVKHQ